MMAVVFTGSRAVGFGVAIAVVRPAVVLMAGGPVPPRVVLCLGLGVRVLDLPVVLAVVVVAIAAVAGGGRGDRQFVPISRPVPVAGYPVPASRVRLTVRVAATPAAAAPALCTGRGVFIVVPTMPVTTATV